MRNRLERLVNKPSWLPWSLWFRELRERWVDTVTGWVSCHVLRRHWVKFGTAPYCARCGKDPRA